MVRSETVIGLGAVAGGVYLLSDFFNNDKAEQYAEFAKEVETDLRREREEDLSDDEERALAGKYKSRHARLYQDAVQSSNLDAGRIDSTSYLESVADDLPPGEAAELWKIKVSGLLGALYSVTASGDPLETILNWATELDTILAGAAFLAALKCLRAPVNCYQRMIQTFRAAWDRARRLNPQLNFDLEFAGEAELAAVERAFVAEQSAGSTTIIGDVTPEPQPELFEPVREDSPDPQIQQVPAATVTASLPEQAVDVLDAADILPDSGSIQVNLTGAYEILSSVTGVATGTLRDNLGPVVVIAILLLLAGGVALSGPSLGSSAALSYSAVVAVLAGSGVAISRGAWGSLLNSGAPAYLSL